MRRRDSGLILPLVLVMVVVVGVVVVAVATYASVTLRQGQVVEASADRLAAADGAMDNALEDIDRKSSLCTLSGASSAPGGYSYTMFEQAVVSAPGEQATINGLDPTVTCEVIGGQVNAVDAFAVIITGEGASSIPLLDIESGAGDEKVFEGPVYIAAPPRDSSPGRTLEFNAPLTIKDGDLWYSSPTCPSPNVDLPTSPSELAITPVGYGLRCIEENWLTLFGSRKPPEPSNPGSWPLRSSATPTPNVDGCYVWEPGRYTSPPVLANNSYNYFSSGDYYFAGMGDWTIGGAHVLAGYPGGVGPGIPGFRSSDTFAGNPCAGSWASDVDQGGAAFYFGGNSRVVVANNGAFEVSGRNHGGYDVGIQALEAVGVRSTLIGTDHIVEVSSGSNKQISIRGLVWAPYAGFWFSNIANDAVAALTGGAVVAHLDAGASASASNFLIAAASQPSEATMAVTATATNTGTTTIRTVIRYRSDGEYAVVSRRVVDITPE